MLCRNEVKDFDVWKPIFDQELDAAGDAGFVLEKLWRSIDDPNEVFFVFSIADVALAKKFISDPSAAEAGERSGVIDGDCWFVEEVG